MPLKEEEVFIKDAAPDMTFEEKNSQLASELSLAGLRKKKIVSIWRIEIGGSGWWVYYRTGRP